MFHQSHRSIRTQWPSSRACSGVSSSLHVRRSLMLRLRHVLAAFTCLLLVGCAADTEGWKDKFNIPPQNFTSTGKNTYFILEPGYQLTLEGKDEGKNGRLIVTVLNETKNVDDV